MRLAKLLTAITTATITLAACTTLASANHLSTSSQAFNAHWTSFEFTGGFGTLRCSLTLEGSLHSRSINKTPELLIGFITRASVGPCVSPGSATVLQASLPWHMRYASFTGILPNIEIITTKVVGFAFEIREPSLGATCLSTSTASSPSTGSYTLNASGSVTGVSLGGDIPCRGAINVTDRLGGMSSSNSAQTITLI